MRNRISVKNFSGDLLQHQNFEESQEAMKQQLLQLSILLKALDPELCDFLGESTGLTGVLPAGRCGRCSPAGAHEELLVAVTP